MTCIAGLVENDIVYMGGDSAVTPCKRIELALQAAEAFCDGVQGPFVIDCLGGVQ
jgi:hypothetical protein